MDAVYISTKPHVLLSAADNPQDGIKDSCERAFKQRPASEAASSSGLVAAKSTFAQSRRHSHNFSPYFSSIAATTAITSSSVVASPSPQQLPKVIPPSRLATSSSQTTPSGPLLPSRPVNGHRRDGSATTANGALAKPFTTGPSSASPLLLGPDNSTTPKTSLAPAGGESIPLDETVAESRVRELNTSFPSPVLRHNRQPKSAGAQSTTYSQPVIVRTYSGPPQSRSTSSHYRPSSSNRRRGSRASGSRRIPFVSNSDSAYDFASPSNRDFAANSSNDAQSVGWGLATSLFGMARSKAKKSGFIPWPWVGTDGPAQNDEAKLPPLEAFSYKGFMADLQNTTDIRSDLDRIAEICARSRYCLSDRYDSHVTPHGSGANFAASVRQHPNWSKGRRKGSSSPGGPTLQAVPSDDDESSARGMRRRRGGIGGPRRRSVAYGTLETIMSSSRSSEEDKTKKKSAADIKEAVRGRAARKGMIAPEDPAAADEETGGRDQTSASSSSLNGKDKGKHGSGYSEDSPSPDLVDNDRAPPGPSGRAVTSRSSPDWHHGKHAPRRPKSTAFAHAVIGSSRHHQTKRQAATSETGLISPDAQAIFDSSTVPALLSDPALPQTSDATIDFYSAVDIMNTQVPPVANNRHSRRRSQHVEPGVQIYDPDDEALHDPSLYLDPDDAVAASAGIFSGLTHWVPWRAANAYDMTAEQPMNSAHGRSQSHGTPMPSATGPPAVAGPSHAEGSLRELLKTVDDTNNRQKKGKAVDNNSGRR